MGDIPTVEDGVRERLSEMLEATYLVSPSSCEEVAEIVMVSLRAISGLFDVGPLMVTPAGIGSQAPTQWAYDMACSTREVHRARAGVAVEHVRALTDALGELISNDNHPGRWRQARQAYDNASLWLQDQD